MLLSVLRENKRWIAFTYTLILAEFIIVAIMPYLLGKSLDAMLAGNYSVFRNYLILSIGCMLVGFTRRLLDTRVFVGIWCQNAILAINRLLRTKLESTKIISRAEFVRTYASFFEYTIPASVSSLIDIIVSIVMIWMAVPNVSWIVVLAALVSAVVFYIVSSYVQAVDAHAQKVREGIDTSIVGRSADGVTNGYSNYRRELVLRSDLDAINCAVIDVCRTVSEVCVIFALIDSEHGVGTIMATLTYTWKLFQKIGFLSILFNHLKHMQIANRLLTED